MSLFKDERSFLEIANPSTQIQICKHTDVCFFGNYPTLTDISIAFAKNTPVVWLIPMLNDLSEYCGCKDKLTGMPLRQCAEMIAHNFGYLKITEMMLFFYRFKLSRYGRFYGSIDPLIIMNALQEFLLERRDEYYRHEQVERERKNKEDRKEAITWDEYCKLKNIDKENPLTKLKQ